MRQTAAVKLGDSKNLHVGNQDVLRGRTSRRRGRGVSGCWFAKTKLRVAGIAGTPGGLCATGRAGLLAALAARLRARGVEGAGSPVVGVSAVDAAARGVERRPPGICQDPSTAL